MKKERINFQILLAREWLTLITLIFVGLLMILVIYYFDSTGFEEKRGKVYDFLVKEYKEEIGTFDQFSTKLDDPKGRREFYDKFSREFSNFPQYEQFEIALTRSKISNAFHRIGNTIFKFRTIILILTPYLMVQFTRTIMWSFKTLKKEQP